MDDHSRQTLPDVRTHLVLADGMEIVLRTIQPRDAVLLSRGFAELSPDSRYQRFFTPKAALSAPELRALTELDEDFQYAIGVTSWDEEGREIPLGVARYIRDASQRDLAEAAITVVDSMQRRGIGRLLLGALADAAYAHGVRRFRAEVLADNYAVHRLLRGLAAELRVIHRGPGSEELEVVLPRPARNVDPLPASTRALAEVTCAVESSADSSAEQSGDRASRDARESSRG